MLEQLIASGFEILEGLLAPEDLAPVEEALREHRAGRGRAGARRLLSIPAVRTLATGGNLSRLASRFVGASPFPFKATLFEKSEAAPWLVPWHQDRALPLRSLPTSPGWGASSVKAGVLHVHAPARALDKVIALRVHLDPSTASNGPLRVLPGTHALGVLPEGAIERLAREVPEVECLAPAGGIIAMRPLIVHASSKPLGPGPRRVLQIEYAPGGGLGDDAELAVC